MNATQAAILDTPEQIARYSLAVLRTRLKLENAGMKGRGPSALSVAKRMGYKGTRTTIINTITQELAGNPPAPTEEEL